MGELLGGAHLGAGAELAFGGLGGGEARLAFGADGRELFEGGLRLGGAALGIAQAALGVLHGAVGGAHGGGPAAERGARIESVFAQEGFDTLAGDAEALAGLAVGLESAEGFGDLLDQRRGEDGQGVAESLRQLLLVELARELWAAQADEQFEEAGVTLAEAEEFGVDGGAVVLRGGEETAGGAQGLLEALTTERLTGKVLKEEVAADALRGDEVPARTQSGLTGDGAQAAAEG